MSAFRRPFHLQSPGKSMERGADLDVRTDSRYSSATASHKPISGGDSSREPRDRSRIGTTVPGQYIGIADLPNQVYRRALKQGFKLNLMILGEPGLGKSTFINSLFGVDLYGSPEMPHQSCRTTEKLQVEKHEFNIEAKGVRVLVGILDVPGFGVFPDNSAACDVIATYIDERYQEYFETVALRRLSMAKDRVDNRLHCCIYFIAPTGHGLRPLDLLALKALACKINVIPVIAKADTLTEEERVLFREKIRQELKDNDISVYCFPPEDDDDDGGLVGKNGQDMSKLNPFSVIGSNTVITLNGAQIRGRKYPWGCVDIENSDYSDLALLRRLLLFNHLSDLVNVTDGMHYGNYLMKYFGKLGHLKGDSVTLTFPPSRTFTEIGANPLGYLEANKTDTDSCIAKLERELQNIFDQKVAEKIAALDNTENELQIKYAGWERDLEERRKNLAIERNRYNAEKSSLTETYPNLPQLLLQEMQYSNGQSIHGSETIRAGSNSLTMSARFKKGFFQPSSQKSP